MKIAFLAIVALFTVCAHAASPAEREAHFETCMANDASWHSRWGKYVVSFDADEAFRICRDTIWWAPSVVRAASCRHNGEWLEAGFYCDEVHAPANM